jgi:hypothetical protein
MHATLPLLEISDFPPIRRNRLITLQVNPGYRSNQASNLDNVMCRSTLSVDWQGFLSDSGFNQQLGISLAGRDKPHLRDLLVEDLQGYSIRAADQCFGCTAGQGSSCGGALTERFTATC